MEPRTPHAFAPRKILLAATGLSPQILTETLYALAVAAQPRFIPDEVHIVTTREGAEYARHTLLEGGMGRLGEFVRDFHLEGTCRFADSHIHVIADPQGNPLSDIQTPEENLWAANGILKLVQRFTRDANTALHVSIAGGRKTMGFFLGYALSLCGRPQDRLSHVLVSAPFESNHEFYYPPPEPRILFDRNNKPINTADARITLADIPFVRLRAGLPENLINGEASFDEIVRGAQGRFEPPRLCISGSQILCGDTPVTMPPVVRAFYLWLVRRKKSGLPPIRHTEADPEEFLREYRRLSDVTPTQARRLEQLLRKGMDKAFFEQKKSRANALIKARLGRDAMPYLIHPVGKRPTTRFEPGLAPEAMEPDVFPLRR